MELREDLPTTAITIQPGIFEQFTEKGQSRTWEIVLENRSEAEIIDIRVVIAVQCSDICNAFELTLDPSVVLPPRFIGSRRI